MTLIASNPAPQPRSARKKSVKLAPPGDATNQDLGALAKASTASLRQRFKILFGSEPPPALGADLLRRCIAHRIQTKAFGMISSAAQRTLDHLVKAAANKPNAISDIPRKIKPGSELIRTWQGKTYRVVVTPAGFSYRAKEYASLSEIASHITGTNWNGPRFFGLRSKTEGAPGNVE